MLLMILASTFAIATFLWQARQSLQAIEELHHRHHTSATLRDAVLYDHDAMGNALMLYARNADPTWLARYNEAGARLAATKADLVGIVPADLAVPYQKMFSQSDLLQKIQNEALAQAQATQTPLVLKDTYLTARHDLNARLVELGRLMDDNSEREEAALRRQVTGQQASLVAVLAALVLTWLVTLRLLQRWHRNLMQATGDRQRAEQQLDTQTLILKKIVENLPVGLFVKNVRHNYRWDIWNKKAEELFGLPAQKVLGSSDFDHFPEHEARFFRRIDEKVMAEGRVIDIPEEEVTSERGTWLAHTIKVPIYDDLGQPSMLLGIIEDITATKQQADARLQAYAAELEQKNDELEEARTLAETADRAKTQFLATMSHEIRTPLNGVIGTADLLGRTELNSKQDDYVRTIQKSAETLLYVINDILDLTKLEAKQLGLEDIAFDFSRMVEDVIDINSAHASKKELDLLMRYAPGTPERIFGDPGRLRQILNNFIGNALKFTETGHVLVDVETLPGTLTPDHVTLRIAVRDTGIGIAPDHQKHIFERFVQAEASTTRKYGGSGLGLAICKQLVELMGGEIGLDSKPGEGSSFWFTLPSQRDTAPVVPLARVELTGKTVMVVDDNLVNLNIIKELLEYWQCACVRFESGNAALAWLETSKGCPDAAIIDHDMPELSGGDLGENLRLHPLTAEMPMMVFSSRGMRGDTSYFEEKGFNGYLVKPSRPEELRLMLEAILANPNRDKILTRHTLDEHNLSSDSRLPDGAPHMLNLDILAVEDDPVNQKVVRLMLEEMGCRVQLASSGPISLDIFKAAVAGGEAFDLILMDMQMPGMDGPDVARLMRAHEAETGATPTPIVALTANAMAEHRDLCLEAGMDGYMTKPISRAKLLEQIGRWAKPGSAPAMAAETDSPDLASPPADDHLAGLDAGTLAELMEVFKTSAQECLGLLEQAQLFDDSTGWQRAAHRLKGAAASFGKESLRAACAEAEHLPPEAREAALEKIRSEVATVAAPQA